MTLCELSAYGDQSLVRRGTLLGEYFDMRVGTVGEGAAEIEAAGKDLDMDSLDTLMKFIYAGFENPNEGSSAHLLVWHEKVFAASGLGSIVRVLADKRRA